MSDNWVYVTRPGLIKDRLLMPKKPMGLLERWNSPLPSRVIKKEKPPKRPHTYRNLLFRRAQERLWFSMHRSGHTMAVIAYLVDVPLTTVKDGIARSFREFGDRHDIAVIHGLMHGQVRAITIRMRMKRSAMRGLKAGTVQAS